MRNLCFLRFFIAAAVFWNISAAHDAIAGWSNDPAVNTPVSVATNNQEDQRIQRDESGGAIIVWTDYRSGGS